MFCVDRGRPFVFLVPSTTFHYRLPPPSTKQQHDKHPLISADFLPGDHWLIERYVARHSPFTQSSSKLDFQMIP